MAIAMKGPIKFYRKGPHSYQLAEDWFIETGLVGHAARIDDHIRLGQNGRLHILEGYVWDGPSGPTIDTPASMRGALAHDALYQLAREGHLGLEMRPFVDRLAYRVWRQDGMNWFRARLWLRALKLFAGSHFVFDPEEVITAP